MCFDGTTDRTLNRVLRRLKLRSTSISEISIPTRELRACLSILQTCMRAQDVVLAFLDTPNPLRKRRPSGETPEHLLPRNVTRYNVVALNHEYSPPPSPRSCQATARPNCALQKRVRTRTRHWVIPTQEGPIAVYNHGVLFELLSLVKPTSRRLSPTRVQGRTNSTFHSFLPLLRQFDSSSANCIYCLWSFLCRGPEHVDAIASERWCHQST